MNNVGYDFSKLRSVKMIRESHIAQFVLLIILLTPLLIFIPFLGIYLFGSPMDINDIVYFPGDPQYENFFMMYLLITGGICLILIMLIILIQVYAGKDVVFVGETTDLEKIVYFESKRKAVYASSKVLIIYDKVRDNLVKDTNKDRILEQRSKYVFWLELDQIERPIIKNSASKIKIKYKPNDNQGYTTKVYTLHLDDSGQLKKYHETIYTYRYGNSNIKGFTDFHIVEANHVSTIPYHDRIKREISNLL